MAVEFLADLSIWITLEIDGYRLSNVVYRFSFSRILSMVFFILCALISVRVGDEITMIVAAATSGSGINVTAAVNLTTL